MYYRSTLALSLSVLLSGIVSPGFGAITVYSNVGDLLAASQSLAVEDFEEARLMDGGILFMDSGLDASTSNAVFSPGEILAGIELRSSDHPAVNGLFAIGNASPAPITTSKVVGSTFFVESLDVLFTLPVNAVGMDIQLAGATNSQDVILSVFDANGLAGTHTISDVPNSPGVFWGMTSDTFVTRINIADAGGLDAEIIDNLHFGTAVPETHALVSLLLGSAFALIRLRKPASVASGA